MNHDVGGASSFVNVSPCEKTMSGRLGPTLTKKRSSCRGSAYAAVMMTPCTRVSESRRNEKKCAYSPLIWRLCPA